MVVRFIEKQKDWRKSTLAEKRQRPYRGVGFCELV